MIRRNYHKNNLDKIFRISRFLRFSWLFMKRIVHYVLFLLLFTSYRTVQHDELFEQIVNKSCRNAFIVTLLTTAIIMFIEMLFPNPVLQEIDIALIFGTLILTFGFSMFFTINLLTKWKMHHGVRNENKRIPRQIEYDARRFSETSWCTS